MEQPITPPPKLIVQWASQAVKAANCSSDVTISLATQATRWGSNQELRACLELLEINGCPSKWIDMLRAARRPNLPSLKERIASAIAGGKTTVALALLDEALPDD